MQLLPLTVDVESRSRADIECCGSTKYAKHPSTEVLCVKYGYTVDDVKTWLPGNPIPPEFSDERIPLAAQRAGFEVAMFKHCLPRYGFPSIPNTRWRCSAAMAGYAGLPQGLDKISEKLDLGQWGKDKAGHENMLKLCRPFPKKLPKLPPKKKGDPPRERRKAEPVVLVDGIYEGGEFNNDNMRHLKNIAYCEQDVVAEIVVQSKVPPLPEREQRAWQLHQKINERGIPVDLDLCRGAVEIIKKASARYLEELADITGGAITTADQRDRIVEFCTARGVDMRQNTSKDKKNKEKPNIQEATVTAVLERGGIDETCKRILEIRQLLNSAAVKKFQATIDCADEDWRVRDGHNYYGAGPGRWSGALAQFQNLIRPTLKADKIEAAIPVITAGDYHEIERMSGGDPFLYLANCVRSIILAPPGRKLVVSDFSGIEARKLAWLAGCDGLINLFLSGADPYVSMAGKITGCTPQEIFQHGPDGKIVRDANGEKVYVDGGKRLRQIGKCPFLGCGYQLGWSTLIVNAKKQAGVELDEELSRTIIDTFRSEFPEIPQFWRDIENGAKWCVRKRKKVVHKMFQFRMFGPWLVMRLPCGRELFYFRPRFEKNDEGRDELVYDSPRGTKQLYGGLLTENITQASSRDLLVDAMFRQDAMGLDLFMHCHDETVVECDAADEATPKLVHWTMEQVESWAEGCPVTAETKTSERYEK
jgi:DNA polymerase bacteriophage-type